MNTNAIKLSKYELTLNRHKDRPVYIDVELVILQPNIQQEIDL